MESKNLLAIRQIGEVSIHLESEIEEYTQELGYVEWKPYGGEAEHGNIKKNLIGGFTIYLDESISYSFEITNYEAGNIEFSLLLRANIYF